MRLPWDRWTERPEDQDLDAWDGPLLDVQDLTVRFNTEDGVVNAVRGVSYSLDRREVLAIVGESGSGKSVSSLALMGLLPSSAEITGHIFFEGKDLTTSSGRETRSIRGRRIAMIFQDPMTALNPVYSVGDQLAEAMRSHEAVSHKIALDRAAEMLALVGIPRPKDRLKSYPHEFSGGMRQRVMIAMAVINNPDLIIADEPTTALDVTVQAQILEKLMEVKDAVDAAIVLITHDLGVVAGTAQRVLVMYAGRPVELGTTDQVFARPRMPYTAGLLGSIPNLDAASGRLRPIPGAPPSLINLPTGCPFSARCPLVRQDCRESEPTLHRTDAPNHAAACHHWDELADLPDPTAIFRAWGVPAR
ncbi:MAG TPA: ABC transporter ATP-binding protein [Kineosporiaceae bacterium]|nr:ABC transporter ATP-binding protein [Kineosporiaceae bacterium]